MVGITNPNVRFRKYILRSGMQEGQFSTQDLVPHSRAFVMDELCSRVSSCLQCLSWTSWTPVKHVL